MSTVAQDTLCVCGCKQVVPPSGILSIWQKGRPYWAWMCPNGGCEARLREQRNQTGDPECPWCHRQRRLIGHFAAAKDGGTGRGYRTTVLGEKIRYATNAAQFFFQPPKGEWEGK